MKVNRIRQNLLPLLTAMIWGTAFVAQSVGAEHMGAFTFNTARAVIAFVFLLILWSVLTLVRRNRAEREKPAAPKASRRELLTGGLCCGTALTVASYFQQKGLETTTAGKAGFVTALYIVLVPLLGLILGRQVKRSVWCSVALAVAGLYCLCVSESFTVTGGDLYLLLCAFCFAVQIMTVDHFSQRVDGVALSCVQFFVMSVLSAFGMMTEVLPDMSTVSEWIWPVLYVGVFSSGVAYTLQILSQKDADPSVVSLLMSLESLFATVAGALILHDRMSGREYLGCALMLAAVILTQLPEETFRRLAPPSRRTAEEGAGERSTP